jgi:GT2 family glycosyltransferase
MAALPHLFAVSVVIPTRNRRAPVHRLLSALAADHGAPAFEVILVDDGSTDDTIASVQRLVVPFSLRVISQRSSGPAAARNAGAHAARGEVLLFLDDDVEPQAGTIAAHTTFHAAHPDVLGLGDLPPVVTDTSFFGTILRGWWEAMLVEIRQPGHRFGFRNVLTGHLSIRREQFLALGGFDAELRCHEDWEFGYRAMLAGLRLRFVPGALALHHETSSLAKALTRKFDEGVADVQLVSKHPELGRSLPLSWFPASRKARVMRRLAWVPAAGDAIAAVMLAALPLYESVKLRFRWRATLELVLGYWYWRGVASRVRDRHAVVPLATAVTDDVVHQRVDLAGGLARAGARLDAVRPAAASLYYRRRWIGTIQAVPGFEPLGATHLRSMLSGPFRPWLMAALRAEDAVPEILRAPSTDAGGRVADVRAPLMRDEDAPAKSGIRFDVQHRPAVPPVHDVA